ncbi:hypothetical protein ABW19_dt0203551 [Dactylella cylindrospora]|nr:hypothetical protein ABW19_dt0203551 [Dactylella cylindrospora]
MPPPPRRGTARANGPPPPLPAIPAPANPNRNRVVANFNQILARQGAAGFRPIGGLETAGLDDDTDDELLFNAGPPEEGDEDEEEEIEEEEEEEEESDGAFGQQDGDQTEEGSEEDEEIEEGEEEEEEGEEEEGVDGEGEPLDSDATEGAPAEQVAAPSPSLAGLKEIGHLASWTVSTSKPGCGVAELRSEDTNLFWQSDGPQPHLINIHFAKRVFVKRIRIFLDFQQDESYTPTKIAIYSGTGYHDLQEVCILDFNQPVGWQEAPLDGVHADGILRTFLIQVCVLSNHQNGKDTHVRGLQIYSPLSYLESQPHVVPVLEQTTALRAGSVSDLSHIWSLKETKDIPFSTVQMLSELELR